MDSTRLHNPHDIDTLKCNVAPLGAYMNTHQLADIFGVSKSTLHQLRRQGDFPKGIKIGHNLRFAVSDIQAWIDSQNGANA